MMPRLLAITAALLAAAPLCAQAGYRAQPDTLYFESLNPYRMWFVDQSGDTVGSPVRAFTVERQVWRGSAAGLTVDLVSERIGVNRDSTVERLELTRQGRVLAIDGQANKERGRYDFVVRFPAGLALAEGAAWADTSRSASPVQGGDYSIGVVRQLRVERLVDSLGSRVAVIRAAGEMHYRDVFASEQPGKYWWIDVAGPTRETFVFDVRNGRQLGREWWMDLRGTAGFPRAGAGVDTLGAGLFSTDTTRMVAADRARLHLRGLPAGDTTRTFGVDEALVLLHTSRRAGEVVEAGAAERGGSVTTARFESRGGEPVRVEVLRTAPHREPLRREFVVDGARLRVAGAGDTVLAVPPGPWAVADDTVTDHLAAVLARAGRRGETQVEVAVLDPFTLQWRPVRAQVGVLEDVFLAGYTVEDGGGEHRGMMLVGKAGELLFSAAVSEAAEVVRTPAQGSPAGKRVGALLAALQAVTDEK